MLLSAVTTHTHTHTRAYQVPGDISFMCYLDGIGSRGTAGQVGHERVRGVQTALLRLLAWLMKQHPEATQGTLAHVS